MGFSGWHYLCPTKLLLILANGYTIMATVDSIRSSIILQVISSSEHSGSLAGGLQHIAQLEADDLNLQDDMLAEWLPRLVYAGVVIWIAKSLIGF